MIVTSILLLAVVVLSAWPGAVQALELDRAAVLAGEGWRLLTGHLVHTSVAHAVWDAAALLLLGPLLERPHRGRYTLLLLASAVAVSVAVVVTRPDLHVYRGLSGVATALFGALAVDLIRTPGRRGFGLAALGLAVLKVAAEVLRGEPVFAENGAGFTPVAAAHVSGLLAGVAFATFLPSPSPSLRRKRTMFTPSRRLGGALAFGLLFGAGGVASAEDRHVAVPLDVLDLERPLPADPIRAWWWFDFRVPQALRLPRVVLDGAGEAYVGPRPLVDGAPGANGDAPLLVLRLPEGAPASGRIFLEAGDGPGMESYRFRVPPGREEDDEAAAETYRAVAKTHFERLAAGELPGAAWFRYRARTLAEPKAPEAESPDDVDTAALVELAEAGATPTAPRRPPRDSELERTYGLFTGARAMAENLQLDNLLVVATAGEATVDVDSLPGITVEEIDWAPLVAGKAPEIDPLASRIPADQHALFFPSFRALVALADEAARIGTPVARLLEEQAIDADTRRCYERQLCLELDVFARTLGPRVVKSVAITGSDPYLRTGSDVLVLLECAEPDALLTFLAARRVAAVAERQDARTISGTAGGLDWTGLSTDDRAISTYVARDGDVVLVTNSVAQLERFAKVRGGEAALSSLPEMTFFRDRYRRDDPAETAFLYLSDATIRRWCSARWRIGASRRIRAQAALAHDAAREAGAQAGLAADVAPIDARIPATYGTLEFVTPIAELDLERVTEAEAEAYRRFRNGYQQNWRGFFDPIALRIDVGRDTIATDVTVMPMIEAADAREWLEVTRGATLAPGDGDPHEGVLFHYVQAIDLQADPVRELRSMATGMLPGADPLAWIGDHVAFYVDDDPVFDEPEVREDPEDYFEDHLDRLPIALAVDVADPVKLALFLTALRAFSDQAAPGVLRWETLTEGERPYVRITASEGGDEGQEMSLCYAIVPGRLVVSPSEALLKRAVGRATPKAVTDGADGNDDPTPAAAPFEWPGRHVSVRISSRVAELLESLFGEWQEENGQLQSWRNLFVLNEWRRLFPEEDPVVVHERWFSQRLVCPGGGEYVWNERDATMESSAYGHPGAPRREAQVLPFLSSFVEALAGVTFEHDGLRARAELRLRPTD